MRSLVGHKKDVRAVAYTPDGRVLSGGADGTARLWDALSGECTLVLKAKGPVYAVAASPDGKLLAYGGRYAPRAESNFVYLCDTAGKQVSQRELRFVIEVPEQIPGTWEFRQVPRADPRSVWSLAYSADGHYLAAACRRMGGGNFPNGGGGAYWPVNASRYGPDAPLPADAYAVAFSPAGYRLAITRRKAVRFTDLAADGAVEYPITMDWSPAVAFVPGQDLAAIAAGVNLFFVNPVAQQKPKRVRAGTRVSALAASPDGRRVLAGSRPGTVAVYDTVTRTRTTSFDFGVGGVHGLAIAPDGLTFAVAGDQGLVVCDMPE